MPPPPSLPLRTFHLAWPAETPGEFYSQAFQAVDDDHARCLLKAELGALPAGVYTYAVVGWTVTS